MKKKTLSMLIALVLVLVCAVGGTLAWLSDTSGPVKNTFTTSDVDISLTETEREYQMIPGFTIEKDPKITVDADSEKCYVFVKVEESSNFDDFMTYGIAAGWETLEAGVYYRVVDPSAENPDLSFSVLNGDEVVVKDSVTKTMMDELTEATYPTLTFTAYATQYMKNNTEHFEPADAWSNAKTVATVQ